MRKNALIICCFACAFGAFGAFFRWLQNQLAFDAVTGMLNSSMWNILVPLTLVATATVFFFLIRKVLGGLAAPEEMYDTFRGTTFFHPIAAWIIGGITAIGGVVTIFSSSLDPQSGALTVIGLLAIVTGISFPSICTAAKKHFSPNLISVFSALPILMFALWLVTCYIRNASIPNVWKYGIEIVAISVIILAFYYNAGFAFGKPKPKMALYTSMLGSFMGLVSLADSRAIGMQIILFGASAMLLMYCWMIVSNMREPDESEAAEEPKPEESEKEAEAEPTEENETVIPAGEKVVTAEPTLQAPTHRDSDVDAIISEVKSTDK
ncbi:MAG: hypothetical protein Q4A83_08370 [Bacillota bacterium]|nr:hypothetical protein [Bacillota bacterium]